MNTPMSGCVAALISKYTDTTPRIVKERLNQPSMASIKTKGTPLPPLPRKDVAENGRKEGEKEKATGLLPTEEDPNLREKTKRVNAHVTRS